NGGSIGIGFAMASNVVSKVVDQLQEFGETRRGWLGVRIQDVTEDVAEAMGLDNTKGALVTDVPEGPAKEAGMLSGDLILSFAGESVENTRELVRIVGNSGVGETVRVVVLRDGQTKTLRVTLGRREDALANDESDESAPDDVTPEATEKTILGLTLSEMTDELRAELGLDAGTEGLVVLDVDAASVAAEKGLAPGDVITEAGQERLSTIADLEDRIEATRDGGRQSLLLPVRRGGDPRFVALPVED
ncbi:MAG TPA: serine protease, partial [Maritimibacter sp.]|nr:serine protease [Maritimibacter sp.]